VPNFDRKNLFGRGVDYPAEQREHEESVDSMSSEWNVLMPRPATGLK
jgi:hypothetical protein